MVVKTLQLKNFPIAVHSSRNPSSTYHNHNYYELVYVIRGMAQHIVNGEHRILSKGNYFLLSPNDEHMYVSLNSDPFKIINLMFDPSVIDSKFTLETPFEEIIKHPLIGVSDKNFVASPLATHYSDNSSSMKAIFLNSVDEYHKKRIGYMNVLKLNIIKAIIECVRNVSSDKDNTSKSLFVDEIIKYTNDHYAENVSLSALCNSLGYSVPYVSRVFKEQTGMNFSEYLVNLRIQKACSLLLSTNMSVQDIINAVGYSNTEFFYRAFKKIMGETPTKFRNR